MFATCGISMFLTFSILVFKDTHDVLEGINKLDNTLVVSRFQRLISEQLIYP
jgi:hypothetical protein